MDLADLPPSAEELAAAGKAQAPQDNILKVVSESLSQLPQLLDKCQSTNDTEILLVAEVGTEVLSSPVDLTWKQGKTKHS